MPPPSPEPEAEPWPSKRREFGQTAAQIVLRRQSRLFVQPVLHRAGDRQIGARKRADRLLARLLKAGHHVAARGGHGDAGGRHLVFQRRQPGIVAAPVAQQAPAFAERMLVAAEASGMGRVEAEHQTVEEPAAPARPFDEQPVHLRGQPRQGDVLGKGDLAPDGMAVDPDQTPLRRAFGRHVAAGADIDRAERGFDAGGDRPAGSPALHLSRDRRSAPHRPAWRGAGRGRATGS